MRDGTQLSSSRPGRRSRTLSPEEIARLQALRKMQRDWSWPQLKTAMGTPQNPCPFKLDTLLRAANHQPISEKNHHWLVEWLNAHLPAHPLPQDRKMRAAADDTLEDGETPETASPDETEGQAEKTNRGSR